VLVIENFWSAEERQYFREVMTKASWKSLQDLPNVRGGFSKLWELG
jgi:SM-20-related protein